MADQCIICLDVLDNGPTKTDSTKTELAPKSPNVSPAIYKNDPSNTHKEQSIAILRACGHILHNSCLQAWIEKANSCPICRQPFNLVEVYDKVDGSLLSSYNVENKKQVADFDPADWIEDEDDDATPCAICGSADNEEVLLLCDKCDSPYHTHCVALDDLPIGDWFCSGCVDQTFPATNPISSARSPVRQSRTWTQRTQAQVRRARHRAAADNWAGAWNQISGRVWDYLHLDLDYSDEDEELVIYRNDQSRRERERREFQQWQQRLNIASRQGAREMFRTAARPILNAREQPETPREKAEEEKAWEAFEKARESDGNGSGSRKRKARSITRSPVEQSTEPERKLKRPKTRRVVNNLGSSSHRGFSQRQSENVDMIASTSVQANAGLATEPANAPSFLSSLLKEVEMSTSTDDESVHLPHGIIMASPSAGHSSPAVSPSTSNYSTPRAMSTTPPPPRARRPGSPLPLTSRVDPIYPPVDYSPNRSPLENHHQSDGERQGPVSPSTGEIRQPRPRRKEVFLPRSEDSSPTRANMSIEAKERINKIVRNALEPHYKKPAGITKEQYVSINRLVSRMLYERIVDPEALDENKRSAWEKIAAVEVTKAVEAQSP